MSGGEESALLGPSIMPGGDRTAYGKVEQIFTSIAAQVDRVPCCTLSAHRRRGDGPNARVDAVGLVPGDVVVLEAGDRVPAGGRLLSATSLWVQESALTGEAQPVVKSATAQVADWAPLG